MVDVEFVIGNDLVKTAQMRVAPGDGEWVKIDGRVYVVAKLMHEYSPATDGFTAHVLIAPLPTEWLMENAP